jgi:2-oxoacid:acceptor oxidoreductase delta subunit (pyruvate/2-ketoisovalerate family)
MDKPFAITLDPGSSRANHTGDWRTERPVYVSLLPPCNDACPAGENIQQWLYHAEEGGGPASPGGRPPGTPDSAYATAWRQILADNPFPAIMGRVCYRPCETACNRAKLDAAVGINSVERFLGDEAIAQGWLVQPPPGGATFRTDGSPAVAAPTGKRVLVVGAGPSGLSAAYHLTRLGHAVTIKDAGSEPGGMMRYGIPKYRLPRGILDAEINRILDLGVTLELNTRVTDLLEELGWVARPMAETAIVPGAQPSDFPQGDDPPYPPKTAGGHAGVKDGFDAAFVAVGAHIGKRAYIPAGDSARIMDAVSMLHSVEDGEPPMLGRRVAVYGGGNTAMDAARTARRLGASEAVVVYRRTRDRMPAHDIEVEEALEEGITMRWLSTVAHADAGKLVIEKMRLDETGFPQPTGEFEELAADCLVLALGQDADLAVLDGVPGVTFSGGTVDVGPDLMTGYPGIFAGGDMVPAERTVTVAIGHGKKAARSIDAWLRGTSGDALSGHGQPRHDLAAYEGLNTWYYSDAPAAVRPKLESARRIGTFDEVTGGLDASTALFEARRCMSCGNCFGCDNCYGSCPDNAVIKLAEPGPGGYAIDYDYCKGCGVCAAECPCGAITMVPEEI